MSTSVRTCWLLSLRKASRRARRSTLPEFWELIPAERGPGCARLEAKQPVLGCAGRGGWAAGGGESGRDSPGAGGPGHGLSRLHAQPVGAQPTRGQPGACASDLDAAGDFELVASERYGAHRHAAPVLQPDRLDLIADGRGREPALVHQRDLTGERPDGDVVTAAGQLVEDGGGGSRSEPRHRRGARPPPGTPCL